MLAMDAMDASRADERSTENEGDDEGWAARRVMNGWIDRAMGITGLRIV